MMLRVVVLMALSMLPLSTAFQSDSSSTSFFHMKADESNMHSSHALMNTGRRLHADDGTGALSITSGSEIIQQLPGAATFSTNRSFPKDQSAGLSLVLSLTPAVVSAACITVCLFVIYLLMGKTVAWCVQVMLCEVFGMLSKFMQTFTDPWSQYHPAVPTKRCKNERKKRRWFSWALTLTFLVGAVGWISNAGMIELIKKRAVPVKGKSVSGFSVCLTEGEKVVDLPRGCSSVAIYVEGNHPNFGSSSRFEVCYESEHVQVPVPEQNSTRIIQMINAGADGQAGHFSFVVSQGQWRHVFKSSAFVATESDRFLMKWERAGELGDGEKFEKLVSGTSLLGCADVQPAVPSRAVATEWAAKNCSVGLKDSFTGLAKGVVSNMAIENAVFTTYLSPNTEDALDGDKWKGSVIGYAIKGCVSAWLPIFIACFAWIVGMIISWRMYLAGATIVAGKCIHACLHDGESLREIWELEDFPEEKKYRSSSNQKNVLLGMYKPAGYTQESYFDAGDHIEVADGDHGNGPAGVAGKVLRPLDSTSSDGAHSGSMSKYPVVSPSSVPEPVPSQPPARASSSTPAPVPVPILATSTPGSVGDSTSSRPSNSGVAPIPVTVPPR